MQQLYPLKFTPILKDKIWGGKKLNNLLYKSEASDKAGESWEISGVKDNVSEVANGFLAGNNLQELIEVYMGDLVGQKVFEKFGTEFPLLIKYIDAADDLSIQVHPNDKQAAERHNSFGKTEMWYVMQADEDARLISGFNQEVDKDLYLQKLEEKKILDILNSEVVKPGDVFFMPAGRIHAIGSGCLIAEIQQTSDITYRVYDFDRKDDHGNTRELHTEQAVDVIDYSFYSNYKTSYKVQPNIPGNLAKCEYFTTNLVELSGSIERDMVAFDSFVIYMCVDGQAEIIQENQDVTVLKKGETVLVPAELTQYYLRAPGHATLLEVYIEDTNDENKNG
jgi:mannose-6-phosphate isomerase